MIRWGTGSGLGGGVGVYGVRVRSVEGDAGKGRRQFERYHET